MKNIKVTSQEKLILERYANRLKWYPIVLILCMIPASINRIYQILMGDSNDYLLYSQVILDSLQGFFICIIQFLLQTLDFIYADY